MSSLAPVRMPFTSYREVNSVDRPCSAASTVPQVCRPLKRASKTAPFAAGARASVTRGSADLDTEDVNSPNYLAMSRTYMSVTQGSSRIHELSEVPRAPVRHWCPRADRDCADIGAKEWQLWGCTG